MNWVLPELLALLFAFITFGISLEIGFRIGARKLAHDDEPTRTHANTLYTATLGLLALLIGFTFAMSVSRFETRKGLMVDQANAYHEKYDKGFLRWQLPSSPPPDLDMTAT